MRSEREKEVLSNVPVLPSLPLGVTIGFDETLYTTQEPLVGIMSVEVCASVRAGSLGRELQVVPEWREVSAQGMGSY